MKLKASWNFSVLQCLRRYYLEIFLVCPVESLEGLFCLWYRLRNSLVQNTKFKAFSKLVYWHWNGVNMCLWNSELVLWLQYCLSLLFMLGICPLKVSHDWKALERPFSCLGWNGAMHILLVSRTASPCGAQWAHPTYLEVINIRGIVSLPVQFHAAWGNVCLRFSIVMTESKFSHQEEVLCSVSVFTQYCVAPSLCALFLRL